MIDLEPVQLRGKFLIPKVTCLYLLGLPLPLLSDFEFSSGRIVRYRSSQVALHRFDLDTCCAHAFPSWMDTLLYSTFATLSHLPLLLTPSPPSTPFSIQCEIIVTTTTRLLKITTPPTFLLHLLPKILQPALAPQKTLRRQVADGLKVKLRFSLIMSKQIVS